METCTVLILTFNHSNTIKRALDSVVGQKTLGQFKILIYDDCSTDDTANIIEDFINERKFESANLKYYRSTENRGITRSYQTALKMIETEYVAILEGDDYWSNIYKLDKQLKYLADNTIFVACTSDYFIQNSTGDLNINRSKLVIPNSFELFSTHDLITNYSIGNFSCAVYRMSALNKLDRSIFDLRMYDWLFNMAISEFGPFIHIREPLSVYNYSGNGEWSKKSEIEQNKIVLELIPSYKNFFKGKYDKQLDSVANVLKNQVNPPTKSNLNKIFSLFLSPILYKLFK